jgi:uncharacterized membrane protein
VGQALDEQQRARLAEGLGERVTIAPTPQSGIG